jgi:hypothetical protein
MKNITLTSPHSDPWAEDFVDLEELNREATDAIAAAVDALRKRARAGASGAAPPALVAVGPAGVGKTHLFGRLRRKLGPHAVLVHIRPLTGAEMTPRFVLGQIIQQLAYVSSHRVPQIDILSGVALATATGGNGKYPMACLEELRGMPKERRERQVEEALETLLQQHADLDPSYLERLIRIPFEPPLIRISSLVWLSGRELDEAQAARIGVREPLPEGAVMSALRTIAVLSSIAAPLVVVFDQLENLVDAEGTGGRVIAYGNLIADLVDVVRDLVIVQMGLSTEWDAHIEPRLGASQRSRVTGVRIPLGLPRPEQSRRLLELWTDRIPEREGPWPWPFTAAQLDAVSTAVGMTPRMLLNELRRILDGLEPLATQSQPPRSVTQPAGRNVADAIVAAWEERLSAERRHIDEMAKTGHGPEPAFLFDGLAALSALAGSIGTVHPEKDGLVRLKGGKGVSHVALLHQANNASVRLALRRLSAVEHDLLAMRERWREWPPTWKATREQWAAFRNRQGVRWHWLSREDATRLLALGTILKDARSQDIDGPDGKPIELAAVERWIREEQKPETWEIARAILGTGDGVEEPVTEGKRPRNEPTGSSATGAAHLLRALRVTSLDRLVRDLARSGGATRASVRAELKAHPAVRWVGDTIVCWTE